MHCVLSLFGPEIPTGMNGSLALLSVERKEGGTTISAHLDPHVLS